MMICYIWETH